MNLLQAIHRLPEPQPWSEGETIPWNEPGFSERMLTEHLSQDHDWASRKEGIIEKHISFIHNSLLSGIKSHILDLGCGPGLYTHRLAKLGHICTGIDFSPASVAYAKEQAAKENLECSYHEADLRKADFGSEYDLVMFIFGELNVFKPEDALFLLRKAYLALKDGGTLVLEPHLFETIEKIGKSGSAWNSSDYGLFFPGPHFYLTENFWNAEKKAATIRHIIIQAEGKVDMHNASMQAYSNEEYQELLAETGFINISFYQSLAGPDCQIEGDVSRGLLAITARK